MTWVGEALPTQPVTVGKAEVIACNRQVDEAGQSSWRRLDKAARLASVMEGREGREGAWKDRHERKKAAGGLRNDQALNLKPSN